MTEILIHGTIETIYMVSLSTLVSYLFGLPLGILSYITKEDNIMPMHKLNRICDLVINIGRSIPFIILMFAITPFTRAIIGTSIGVNAGIVALVISAIPFVARMVENSLNEIDTTLIETVECMGATKRQIVKEVLIRESIPSLIRGASITTITLVGYSAMAGAVGAGGLGYIAVIYGYQQYNYKITLTTVLLIIVVVQILQLVFDKVAKAVDKNN